MIIKPLVATPCYNESLCVNYVKSILAVRPTPDFHFVSGSLITRLRNSCVQHFMSGDWSHLFFIDADIGFEPGLFNRLVMSELPVVSAAAPFRTEESRQGGFTVDISEMGEVDADGFAPIKQIGTGFMCIRRDVFERMHESGISRHQFFDTMIDGDEYLADDHAFCKRWRDIGGEIYIDTNSELTHQGTKTYTGDFNKYLIEETNNADYPSSRRAVINE